VVGVGDATWLVDIEGLALGSAGYRVPELMPRPAITEWVPNALEPSFSDIRRSY
jgi:hypothetical protein